MSDRIPSSFTVLLLLGSLVGCDLELMDPGDQEPGDQEFRSKECWGGGGGQNTFLLPDGSVAGVFRKDLRLPEYHQSPNSAQSLMLERVEVISHDDGSLVDLEEIWADETGLHGRTCVDCNYDGGDFLGARFHISRQAPGEAEHREVLRIDGWKYDGHLPSYRFVYADHPAPAEPGAHACAVSEAGSYFATVYDDVDVDMQHGDLMSAKHHPTLFFACHSSAVVTADQWGWGIYAGLDRETHEAAVRAVRADYCGDGESWTAEGPVLFIQDSLGIHTTPINHVSATLEAIWGPQGAICVGTPRLSQYQVSDVVCDGVPIPECGQNDDLTTYPDALFLTKSFEPVLTE